MLFDISRSKRWREKLGPNSTQHFTRNVTCRQSALSSRLAVRLAAAPKLFDPQAPSSGISVAPVSGHALTRVEGANQRTRGCLILGASLVKSVSTRALGDSPACSEGASARLFDPRSRPCERRLQRGFFGLNMGSRPLGCSRHLFLATQTLLIGPNEFGGLS